MTSSVLLDDVDVTNGSVVTSQYSTETATMGALFAKTGCGACFSRNKRKISPDIICEMKLGSRLERCPSAEIMKELNSCGFLATDITRTTGGLSFDIVSYEDFMTIPPRRSAAVFFRQSRRQSKYMYILLFNR